MSASKAFPAPSKPEAPKGRYSFVARQPVFTTDEKVFGYESVDDPRAPIADFADY